MSTKQVARSMHWFRKDLRLADNPALVAACKNKELLPVFALDQEGEHGGDFGGARRWWLARSLRSLGEALSGNLLIVAGKPQDVIPRLAKNHGVCELHWNKSLEPGQANDEQAVTERLAGTGTSTFAHDGQHLWRPEDVLKKDGTHFRVFTPFFRKAVFGAPEPRMPLPRPKKIKFVDVAVKCKVPRWLDGDLDSSLAGLANHWQVGEKAAQAALEKFVGVGLNGYAKGRDHPALTHVSRLSPHLNFGEISPNTVWHRVNGAGGTGDVQKFLAEMAWREFSAQLLHHNPDMQATSLLGHFDVFPWRQDDRGLDAWRDGMTGVPLVDAGMRELAQTGYMHNRVRIVAASFLVKNLMVDWLLGEAWFRERLVDADIANNCVNWQWVAGCGADPAPFFRIFSPVRQATRFDPQGEYVRRHIPELAGLGPPHLFAPWEAPESELRKANVRLGDNYPLPIVDLSASRKRALEAYKTLPKRQPPEQPA